MLQEEIMKLGDYFRGIEYFNNAIIVKVNFPLKWQVYPSNNELIKPAKSENAQGEYFYYGDMNNVSLDDIFSLIEETIVANKDAEMKVKLLNEKVRELEDIFKRTPYKELELLKFVFDKPEKTEVKPKRKYTKRKKKEEVQTEEVVVASETVDAENNTEKNVETENE